MPGPTVRNTRRGLVSTRGRGRVLGTGSSSTRPASKMARTPSNPSGTRAPISSAPTHGHRAEKISAALGRIMAAYKSGPSTKGLDIPANIARLDEKFGRKYGIPPSVLAAQQRQESGFNPNAVSSAGAFGVSQFIPSTAASYGVKPGDVKSQVKGQAKYLTDLGFQKDPQKALSGYSGGYSASSYNNPVLSGAKDYKQLDKPGKKPNPKDVKILKKAGVKPKAAKAAPQETAKQLKGHYINPYKGLSPGEIDQGVDYGGSNDVKAIGNAVVKDTHGSFSGDWIAYTLTDGPRKGWTVYVAEHVAPKAGLKVGQKVKKGDVIGHMSGGIETGWAAKPGVPYQNSRTLTASQNPSYVATRHNVMSGTPAASDPPEGRDFLAFLNHKPGVQVTSSGISFSGSAGPSTFASALGITTTQAKQMTPRERLSAARKRLNRVTAAYGSQAASGAPAASTGALSSKYGHPAV